MILNHQELMNITGGSCIICALIGMLKTILRFLNIKHMMNHLFVD